MCRAVYKHIVRLVLLESLLDESIRLQEVVDDILTCVILYLLEHHVYDAALLKLRPRMGRHSKHMSDSTLL